MRTILNRSVTAIAASIALVTSASAATDVSLHRGELISQVRARLIKDGWTPIRIDKKFGLPGDEERENQFAEARVLFDAGYLEVETCSGTGLGYCTFNYQKNGECLRIITRGEYFPGCSEPVVEDWSSNCPD